MKNGSQNFIEKEFGIGFSLFQSHFRTCIESLLRKPQLIKRK